MNSRDPGKDPSVTNNVQKKRRSYAIWLLLIALSEIIGTALLVFLACLSTVPNFPSSVLSHFEASVIAGFAVFIAISSVFHISGGHVNPVVTTAALIFKLVSIPAACVYVLAQFAGALLGYGGILLLVPKENLYKPGSNMTESHRVCTTVPSLSVATWQAFLGEFIASAILVFFCCGVWDKKNVSEIPAIPAKVGGAVFLLIAVLGPISGCGINPARAFAPAVFTGVWDHHWLYWLAPLSAAVIIPFFYKFVFEKFHHPDQAES